MFYWFIIILIISLIRIIYHFLKELFYKRIELKSRTTILGRTTTTKIK